MAIWRRNQISVREDDVAENAEVNMWVYRYGKISRVPAAFLKPVMQHTTVSVRLGLRLVLGFGLGLG